MASQLPDHCATGNMGDSSDCPLRCRRVDPGRAPHTFPWAPLSSRTVGFPESGWQQWLSPAIFPCIPRLKCSPTCASGLHGYTLGSTPWTHAGALGLCPAGLVLPGPPLTESLFAHRKPSFLWGGLHLRLGGRYPAVIAPTGSCARPNASHDLRFVASAVSLCRLLRSPCWQMVLPDVISTILAWVLGPVPRHDFLVHVPV